VSRSSGRADQRQKQSDSGGTWGGSGRRSSQSLFQIEFNEAKKKQTMAHVFASWSAAWGPLMVEKGRRNSRNSRPRSKFVYTFPKPVVSSLTTHSNALTFESVIRCLPCPPSPLVLHHPSFYSITTIQNGFFFYPRYG
jgi:hypothetical protein